MDLRDGEWQCGAGGLEMMRLGTRMSPLGRVAFGRRCVMMGMGGGAGRKMGTDGRVCGGGVEEGEGEVGEVGGQRLVLLVDEGMGEGERVRGEVEALEGEGWARRLVVEEG